MDLMSLNLIVCDRDAVVSIVNVSCNLILHMFIFRGGLAQWLRTEGSLVRDLAGSPFFVALSKSTA